MAHRAEMAAVLAALKENANWRQYVTTLEGDYNRLVDQLLDSDHPDEALRGQCRAIRNLLKNINKASGDLT
jgi:ribonuclease HI